MAEETAAAAGVGAEQAAAKVIAGAVFAAGITLLVLVFWWARLAFLRAASLDLGEGGNPGNGAELGVFALGLGARVLLLMVMGYLASLIATKGIELYRACAPRS